MDVDMMVQNQIVFSLLESNTAVMLPEYCPWGWDEYDNMTVPLSVNNTAVMLPEYCPWGWDGCWYDGSESGRIPHFTWRRVNKVNNTHSEGKIHTQNCWELGGVQGVKFCYSI